MSTLRSEAPGGSFRLGLVLFLVMATDVMMTLTVGAYLTAHGSSLWHASGFVLLSALLIGLPLLVLLMLGGHADTLLPRMRGRMNANSWLVSEAVIVFFLVMEVRTVVTASWPCGRYPQVLTPAR